jgi:hypothetical protein
MEFATRAEKEEAAVISKQVQDGGADADH